jgi:hypothetical protein
VLVENTLVTQVQDEGFVIPGEKSISVGGVIGVDGRLAGDKDYGALLSSPARAPSSLPQTHHRGRQANAHHHVNCPDVDAEFQGAG